MEFTRNLSRGMSGDDVMYAKQRLVALGLLYAATKRTFGNDTFKAVKEFQRKNGLGDSGEIDAYTWDVLFGIADKPSTEIPVTETPAGFESLDRFSADIKNALIADLSKVSDLRRNMCLDAIDKAIDPAHPGLYPRSLYIRGGNLYNTDLTPNVITISRIRSGAKRQPEFYDGGRQDMMEEAVAANPLITGADCSGGVVGLQRHAGIVKPDFDMSADSYNASSSYTHVSASELVPGDPVHKSGHLGMYVGGGYVVEWAGGAFGCQLTKLAKRRVYNYVSRQYNGQGNWTSFLHAKRY